MGEGRILFTSDPRKSTTPRRCLFDHSGIELNGKRASTWDRAEGLAEIHFQACRERGLVERNFGTIAKDRRRALVEAMYDVLEVVALELAELTIKKRPPPPGKVDPFFTARRRKGLDSAHAAGVAAGRAGKDRRSCPYRHGRGGYRNAWITGFQENR